MKFPLASHQATREKSVTDQAAAWMATLSDEACSAEEQRRFSQWLTQSNSHIHEFLRISTLMRHLQRRELWPEVDLDSLIADAKASNLLELPRAEQPSSVLEKQALSGQSRPWWRRQAAAALAATVVVAVSVAVLKAPAWLAAKHTYSTGLGELRSITLEDGSIVELDSKSSIRARLTPQARLIELTSGEAVFKVTKDPRRAFKVSTPLADVLAVGTEFDVKTQATRTVVTVIEGRVAVAPQPAAAQALETSASGRASTETSAHRMPWAALAGKNHLLLTAGEQVVVTPGPAQINIAQVDPAKATGWTMRRLYFEDTALSEVANEFARYSPEVIQIRDKALGERRISGTFDSSDPQALVRFLEHYTDTRVTRVPNGWVLEPGKALPK